MDTLLRYVLGLDPQQQQQQQQQQDSSSGPGLLGLDGVEAALAAQLQTLADETASLSQEDNVAAGRHPLEFAVGRLGPREAKFDLATSKGCVVSTSWSGHEVESINHFGSARANVCFFKGKWMYEATLVTTGIHQIGWSTLNCSFTKEAGVGDERLSYAYDGKRSCKWNKDPTPYGHGWVTGDVIGCLIDLDDDTIEYYHNGKSMGRAFERIRANMKGMALFPSFSMSEGEKCTYNFGATAFKYPVNGYLPVDMSISHAKAAQYLLGCLDRLLPYYYPNSDVHRSKPVAFQSAEIGSDVVATICAYHVVEQLVSIMLRKSDVEDPVVFDHIVPALFKYHEEGLLDSVLGILLEHMEDHEREPFVNKLMHAMGSLCRVASIIDLHSLDSSILPLKVCAPTTSVALAFVLALLNTPAVLQNWTESSGRFSQTIESLFFLKSPNQVDLRTLIPSTFWDKEHADAGECLSEAAAKQALVPIDVELRKVEHLQSQIALLLLGSSIRKESVSASFLTWLRALLYKNRVVTRSVRNGEVSNPSVLMNVYFALLRCIRAINKPLSDWAVTPENFGACNLQGGLSTDSVENNGTAFMFSFFEFARLGGTVTHLRRELASAKGDAMPLSTYSSEVTSSHIERSLVLLNAAMLIHYYVLIPCYKASSNSVQTRDDLLGSLHEVDERIRANSGSVSDAKAARPIVVNQLLEAGRSCYWNELRIFDRQNLVNMMSSFELTADFLVRASPTDFFSFIPEYYVETLVDSTLAISKFEHDNKYQSAEFISLFDHVMSFLSVHWFDKRVVNPETRDYYLNAVTMLFQEASLVKLLEQNPIAREKFMLEIVNNYEERTWLSIMKILMRVNKSHAWGRIPEITKIARDKLIDNVLKPDMTDGSELFVQKYREALNGNRELARRFVNRLFNNLNWCLTEFTVAMNNVVERPQGVPTVQIFNRYALLSDVTVSLLKSMEFTCQVCPAVFFEEKEVMLLRVIQLVLTFLGRFTTGNNSKHFNSIVASQHVPNQRYTVLAPVFGIIHAIVSQSTYEKGVNVAEQMLANQGALADEALKFVLDGGVDLSIYESVSDQAKNELLQSFGAVLKLREVPLSAGAADLDNENLCPICYTDVVSTKFLPCGHLSCNPCIQRQLLEANVCFFCKAKIESLQDLVSEKVSPVSQSS